MMAETEVPAAAPAAAAPQSKALLFNKWDVSEVKVTDPSLVRYVNLTPQIIPHSCGKFSRQEFNKANMMIVERLINSLMQTENNTGKKQLAIGIVRDAFEIINKKTKRNPVEVLVEAIGNTGPREETGAVKIRRHQRPQVGRYRADAPGRLRNRVYRRGSREVFGQGKKTGQRHPCRRTYRSRKRRCEVLLGQ